MRAISVLLAPVAAGALILGAAAPTTAGTTWGPAQEVSSKLGRAITLSGDGTVAAWIRTNRSEGTGPVRTAYYKSAKKGWTSSAPIAGTALVSDVQMSKDGNTILAEEAGTGYVMSTRTSGNTWSAVSTVVSGTNLDFGRMSTDANTLVWVDWTGSSGYPDYDPGMLKGQTRAPGGAWGAVTTVGSIPYDFTYGNSTPLALSSDGTTLAWVDASYALRVSTKQADGTWSASALVKQYPSDPNLSSIELNGTGSTLIWTTANDEGVLYTQRTATGWSPLGYVTTDDVRAAAVSPNGAVVAYGNIDKQLVLRTWNGTKWAKPTVLGSAVQPTIVLRNKTVAWTADRFRGSTLRASILNNGKWQPSTKRSSAAQSPALTPNGRTLAWGLTSNKRIYSTKR